ncbi:MAG: D-alanyl-D-alanine carboxypeptidase [Nitrospira sp.]|nr:D-alanyl-D-alanine carboxypeptidase [Nitrospira sp.]
MAPRLVRPSRSNPHPIRRLRWRPLPVFAAALLAVLLNAPLSGAASKPTLVSSPATSPVSFLERSRSFRLSHGHSPAAHGILLKDLTSGKTLYEYESDRRLSPASLTKIMTALVILEYGQLQDHVTVSRKAAAAPRTHLRLRAGQVFRLEDLLKAMLITSANDACLAAIEHVAGSEEQFVDLMNAKVRTLGLSDTHFSNGCGFDAPDHYATANDLAKLSEIALQNPIFRALVREEIEVISAVNVNRSFLLKTTNRLLGRLPGVEGVKTGFTSRAGRCLIAKVSQDGKELLLVLLHANRRWNTATSLINYGLQSVEEPVASLR